jgi:hypothetical protein
MQSKVLFFNPYSGILEHLKIERDLHRIAENSQMQIDFLRCHGTYSNFCSAMSAMALTPSSSEDDRQDVCNRCKSLEFFARSSADSRYEVIDRLISIEVKTQVSELMSDININNWVDYQFRGVYFGRIASYEFLLRHKLSSSVIPPELWIELRSEIELAITTYLVACIFLKNSDYKLVGVYNFLYGMNRAFTIAAEQLKIETFSVQANGYINNTHARYLIYDTSSNYWHLNSSEGWRESRKYPLGTRQIFDVYTHFKALFDAKSVWTYSAPKTSLSKAAIRRRLGIPEDANITLLTTSSADEQFAFGFVGLLHEESSRVIGTFQNNLEWINETIGVFKRNPEKYLVIRIHPREFANKREGTNSNEGFSLLSFLREVELPENIILNEPTDEISLYDLARITQLLINRTSTVGLEFAVLGIPSITVTPDLLSAYPLELSTPVYSKDSYEELLTYRGSSMDISKVKLAFRWMNFRYTNCTILIPRWYLFLDRFYFGPFMRFVAKYPKLKLVSTRMLDILYFTFDFFDRRKFSYFDSKYGTSIKSRKGIIENLMIRIVLRFLN